MENSYYSRLFADNKQTGKPDGSKSLTVKQPATSSGSLYSRLFTEPQPKPETLSAATQSANVSTPAPAPEKKTFMQKVGGFFSELNPFRNEKIQKTETGKPVNVQMTDQDYAGAVVEVQSKVSELQKRLTQAKQQKDAIEKGKNWLTGMTADDKVTFSWDKGFQTKSGTDKVKLEEEINNIELSLDAYNRFLGKEDKNGSFVQKLIGNIVDEPTRILPFVRDIQSTDTFARQYMILKKAEKGEKLDNYETSFLDRYFAQNVDKLIEKDLGDQIADVVTDIPSYAIAFALTGGTYTAGSAVVTKGLSKVAMPALAKRLVAGSVGTLVQSNFFVPTIARSTAEYMLPKSDLIVGKQGDELIANLEKGDDFGEALRKGYLSTVIEVASERAGAIIEGPMDVIKKATIGKFAQKFGIQSPKILQQAAKQLGWNGIIGEVFEEELAELGQAPVEERKYYAPFITPEGTERILVSTLGIGAFGGIGAINSTAWSMAAKVRAQNQVKPLDIPVKEDLEAAAESTPLPAEISSALNQNTAQQSKSPDLSGLENEVGEYAIPEELEVKMNQYRTENEINALSEIDQGKTTEELSKTYTIGEIQRAEQRSKGLNLLADMDNALNNNDIQLAEEIVKQIEKAPDTEAIAQYKKVAQLYVDQVKSAADGISVPSGTAEARTPISAEDARTLFVENIKRVENGEEIQFEYKKEKILTPEEKLLEGWKMPKREYIETAAQIAYQEEVGSMKKFTGPVYSTKTAARLAARRLGPGFFHEEVAEGKHQVYQLKDGITKIPTFDEYKAENQKLFEQVYEEDRQEWLKEGKIKKQVRRVLAVEETVEKRIEKLSKKIPAKHIPRFVVEFDEAVTKYYRSGVWLGDQQEAVTKLKNLMQMIGIDRDAKDIAKLYKKRKEENKMYTLFDAQIEWTQNQVEGIEDGDIKAPAGYASMGGYVLDDISAEKKFDYQSTQFNLSGDIAAKILEFGNTIPESELKIDKEKGLNGLEKDPHITLVYGLSEEVSAEDVRSTIATSEPVSVTLGKVSIFEQDNQDVLKIDIASPQLQQLNTTIREKIGAPGTTFKDYQPHITIAYLNKGEGAKYVGNTQFEGQKLTFKELAVSDTADNQTPIILNGKDAQIPAGFATTKEGTEFAEEPISNKQATAYMEEVTKTINPIEFPEMVRLVEEITGNRPTLQAFKDNALGKFFTKSARIKLNPEIFSDSRLAARVFAHEIGHLVDFVPDGKMGRGNLLGRIASLRGYMKAKFGDLENKEVKKELKKLTQIWKPFNDKASREFTKYRYSSVELYADAISVLFNNPALLKDTAPQFWSGFFEYLGKKPEAEQVLKETWDLLNQSEEAVLRQRINRKESSYEKGRKIRQQVQDSKKQESSFAEKAESWKNQFVREFVTDFQPIYSRLKKLANSQGQILPESEQMRIALEEYRMADNDVYSFMEDINGIIVELNKNEISEDAFGLLLEVERNMTQRVDKANPDGLIGETNAKLREEILNDYSPEQQKKIMQLKQKFHDMVFKVAEEAHKYELYSDQIFNDVIKPYKDSYVTYQVIDYIQENYVSAGIKQVVGTVKEIENPLASTTLKTISTIKAIQQQKALLQFRDTWTKYFPEELVKAKRKIINGVVTGQFVQQKDKKVLSLYEKGKKVGYYVDPYIAEIFEIKPFTESALIMKVFAGFNKVFKPAVTTWNLSWAVFTNIARDQQRNWVNLQALTAQQSAKGVSVFEFLQELARAIPEAWMKDKSKVVQQMIKDKAISSRAFYTEDIAAVDSDTMRPIYQKYRFLDPKSDQAQTGFKKVLQTITKPISKYVEMTEFLGSVLENTSKISAYRILQKRGIAAEKLGFMVRNYTGTPNYNEKGKITFITNTIFPFSNVVLQSLRTNSELIANPKSRGAWMLHTFLLTGLPTMAMLAVAAGLFGDDLKELLRGASEYDKTNYTIIPIGRTETGKTMYFRIPRDDFQRLAGALLWKLGSVVNGESKRPEEVFDIALGMIPMGVNPLADIAGAWLDYVQGKNPYDSFAGRNVLDRDTYEIGGTQATSKLLIWTMGKFGLGRFPVWDENAGTTEYVLAGLPVVDRAVRVTDYGYQEEQRILNKDILRDEALDRQERKQLVSKYLTKYFKNTNQSNTAKRDIKKELVRDYLGGRPKNKDDRDRASRIEKRFDEELYILNADWRGKSVAKSSTNDQKIAVLNRFKEEMSPGDYSDLVRELKTNGIISREVMREVR